MSVDHGVARPRPIRELLLVAALFAVYNLGRVALSGDVSTAHANAAHVWDLERAWHLPSEAALQHAILDHAWLVRAANLYYASVHFPATTALLLWTYLRRPTVYRRTRTTLAVLTTAALAVHILYPLTPPRLLPATGMVDTGHALGPSVYGAPGTQSLANQYAAMPSLHVGWAAVVAIALIASTRSRWRWLWLLHPLLTLAVVVITANHYWLDAAVALALLTATLLLPTLRIRSPHRGDVPSSTANHQLDAPGKSSPTFPSWPGSEAGFGSPSSCTAGFHASTTSPRPPTQSTPFPSATGAPSP